MSVFLQADDLAGWVQATQEMVGQAITDVEAKARLVAPCLFAPGWDGSAEDREVVVSILRMAAVSLVATRGGRVKEHTTGPFSETFRDGASGLSDEDIADLQALCGAVAGPRQLGLPRGTFPSARNYDGLYYRPGRKHQH